MAARLPDGSIVSLATAYGTSKSVTAISNANPGVATSTAHGMSNGDLYSVTSGWSNLNNRVARAAGVTANTFNLDGIDTTSTTLFPAGSGAGSVVPITSFTQISQIMGFDTTGGDQQFQSYSFMEQSFDSQIPTTTSAMSITITIADDPSLPGYQALQAASDARAIRALKLQLPDGSFILYQGYVSFNSTPTLSKGQIMTVKATLSLQGKPVRYAS